ncbi:MAG: hypothetical protein IKG79_04355 [Neisseriaceae bacterium]|nr:hypothetical protein [Neisseriaceae bacterium]
MRVQQVAHPTLTMKIILKNKTESEIIFDKNDLDIISISFNIVHIDEEISSVIGCNESEFFTIYKKITNAVDNKTLFYYEEIRVIYSSITYCFHAVGLDKTKK